MEESLAEVREQEEEMTRANRALSTRLEDVQVRPRKSNAGLELSLFEITLGQVIDLKFLCLPRIYAYISCIYVLTMQ